jgi:hypothetical protein
LRQTGGDETESSGSYEDEEEKKDTYEETCENEEDRADLEGTVEIATSSSEEDDDDGEEEADYDEEEKSHNRKIKELRAKAKK